MSDTASQIKQVCDSIKELLLEKNAKYGDSALEPSRIMSKASPVEQILVRIDDKLSRINKGAGLLASDEDVIQDIIGYFVLLKIALKRQQEQETKNCLDAFSDAADKGYTCILNKKELWGPGSTLPYPDTISEGTPGDWNDFWHNEDVVPNVRETPLGIEIGKFPVKPVKNEQMWDEDDAYMWDPTLGPSEPSDDSIGFKNRDLYDSPFS